MVVATSPGLGGGGKFSTGEKKSTGVGHAGTHALSGNQSEIKK